MLEKSSFFPKKDEGMGKKTKKKQKLDEITLAEIEMKGKLKNVKRKRRKKKKQSSLKREWRM